MALGVVATTATAEEVDSIELRVVDASSLNLRAEPLGAIVGSLRSGTKVRVVRTIGDWAEVVCDDCDKTVQNQRGWVATRYLVELEAQASTASEDDAARRPDNAAYTGVRGDANRRAHLVLGVTALLFFVAVGRAQRRGREDENHRRLLWVLLMGVGAVGAWFVTESEVLLVAIAVATAFLVTGRFARWRLARIARQVDEVFGVNWTFVPLSPDCEAPAFTTLDEESGDPAVYVNLALGAAPRSLLSFIFAHEAAHHMCGHFENSSWADDLALAGLSGGGAGFAVGGPIGGLSGALSALVVRVATRSLTARSYSRRQELEADGWAGWYCLGSGCSLDAAKSFFLEEPEDETGITLTMWRYFVDTHPGGERRVQRLNSIERVHSEGGLEAVVGWLGEHGA